MSEITTLATGQLKGHDAITIELVEADETPAVVIIRWPVKASVVHPHRFPDTFRQSLSQIPSIYAIYAGSLLASLRPVNASVTA